ncbi:MAG: ROK family protein [Clostridia bacterium]|nr:ROK family protein [Clostridia bacterium]
MSVIAGVDIGGTKTKIGIMADKFVSTVIDTPKDAQKLIDVIAKTLHDLAGEIDAVGVGVPGAVDSVGRVSYMPNLGFRNFDIATTLSQKVGARVFVINDANAAALAECQSGGFTDAVMLTLGTGVGGGVILGGKVFDGKFGKAAELGHIIIDVDGKVCGCGNRGCLEAYASASALIRRAKEEMTNNNHSALWKLCGGIDNVDGAAVFAAAKQGDVSAKSVLSEYIRYLSIGVVNVCNIFRPQAVIIGGGISNQGEDLLAPLRAECERLNYGYVGAHKPALLAAKLGALSGMYGAIAFAKSKLSEA